VITPLHRKNGAGNRNPINLSSIYILAGKIRFIWASSYPLEIDTEKADQVNPPFKRGKGGFFRKRPKYQFVIAFFIPVEIPPDFCRDRLCPPPRWRESLKFRFGLIIR
jgi:hypothetical protein